MTDYEINRLLVDWLKQMPSAPPIIEQNMKEPLNLDKAAIFTAVYFMPVDNQEVDYCGSERKTGIFQITVFGKRDKGSKDAQQMSDAVIEHYKSLRHPSLQITKRVAAMAITTETHFQIPISIYYTNME